MLVGQHLLMDLYTSSKAPLYDALMVQKIVTAITEELQIPPASLQCYNIGDAGVLCSLFLANGHMNLRTYPQHRYIAVDFFLEPDFLEEKAFIRLLKKHFSSEKTKITHVKRGDLGTLSDMKPKIKTTSGPIRRVKDTSKKMIGILKRQ